MRKIKEGLRLQSLGLTQSQIAHSCSIGQSTVSAYLMAAEAAGIQWPMAADWAEARLAAALLPKHPPTPPTTRLPTPEFAAIYGELQKHKHLTLQLVWEEYQAANPGGYRYSRFCELYQYWRKKRDLVLRHEHRAGEKMFVDYAGDTIAVHNPSTGESRDTQLFVAVLGASNHTFAEATWTQGLGDWISMSGRSASRKARAGRCSKRWTGPHFIRCRANATATASGRQRGSTSTTTSSLITTGTACRIN